MLLCLSLVGPAQSGEVISKAYEVALGDFHPPATTNGSISFKECDECDTMLVRVTPGTVYTISQRPVQLKEFRERIRKARLHTNAAVTVLHHLESDTVKSVNVTL